MLYLEVVVGLKIFKILGINKIYNIFLVEYF